VKLSSEHATKRTNLHMHELIKRNAAETTQNVLSSGSVKFTACTRIRTRF